MKTSAGKYRFFLILLLVIAVGGGIWYCYQMNKDTQTPKDGTLVQQEYDNGKGKQAQG